MKSRSPRSPRCPITPRPAPRRPDPRCRQRDAALPDRVRDRRGAGHGDRDRGRAAQRGHRGAVGRPGLRVRLRPDDAARAGRQASASAPHFGVALAADTVSIAVMELLDNAIKIVAVPGAMDAGLTSVLFWASLAFSLLVVAFILTTPVNRWMISRRQGPRRDAPVPPLTGSSRRLRPLRPSTMTDRRTRGTHPVTAQHRTARRRSLPAALLGVLAVLAALFVLPGGQATVAPSAVARTRRHGARHRAPGRRPAREPRPGAGRTPPWHAHRERRRRGAGRPHRRQGTDRCRPVRWRSSSRLAALAAGTAAAERRTGALSRRTPRTRRARAPPALALA